MDKSTFFGGMFAFPFIWGILKLVLTGNPAYAAYLVACCMVLDLVETNDEPRTDEADGASEEQDAEHLPTGDSGPEEIASSYVAPADDAILDGVGTSTPEPVSVRFQPDIIPTPVKMETSPGAMIPSRKEAGGRKIGDIRKPHQPKGNLTIAFRDHRLPEDSPFIVKNKNFFHCMQDLQKMESPIRPTSEQENDHHPSLPDDSPFFVKNMNFKGSDRLMDMRDNVPERLESIEGPSREPVVPFENFGARGGTGLTRRGVKFLRRVRKICRCCCCCK